MAKLKLYRGTNPTASNYEDGSIVLNGTNKSVTFRNNSIGDIVIGENLDPNKLSDVVPIEKGGTNATTAADARTNLGLGTAATKNIANPSAVSVFDKVVYNSGDGVTEIAQHLDFHKVGSTADYDFRMSIDSNGNPTFNGKALPVSSGGTGATAKGATLLSNIGITAGTAEPATTGTPGTIYIQYA